MGHFMCKQCRIQFWTFGQCKKEKREIEKNKRFKRLWRCKCILCTPWNCCYSWNLHGDKTITTSFNQWITFYGWKAGDKTETNKHSSYLNEYDFHLNWSVIGHYKLLHGITSCFVWLIWFFHHFFSSLSLHYGIFIEWINKSLAHVRCEINKTECWCNERRF